MKSLLAKEKILYDTVANSLSDKDFFIGFHAYLTFILSDGDKLIIDQIAEKFISRIDEEKSIEAIKDGIVANATKLLDELVIISEKLGLQDHPVLQEEISSTRSLLTGSTHIFGGEFLNSLYDDLFDILKRISDLGYQKEIEPFVELSHSFAIKDINALKERKSYFHKRGSFLKKDARTEEGAFSRLITLFKEISVLENIDFNSLQIDFKNVFRIHAARKMNNEYSKLMSGEIQQGSYYKKEKYMPDIEHVHNFIVLNNLDMQIKEKYSNKIFYIQNDNIFHHEIGLLHYEMNGLKEPKYIQMFKNIITYMPEQKDKVRISELEKHINKKDQHGANYRINLGKSAKSFNNFLKKNGVKNIHPEKKVPVLSVTDEYITFHNKI
jgi:hypothetical protein